jgi:hypothetical protein
MRFFEREYEGDSFRYGPPLDAPTDGKLWVYFIQAMDTGAIKIGFSIDPLRRIKELQTGHPAILKLICCIEGTRADERAFHQRFQKDRYQGEWFHPEPILRHLMRDYFKPNF